MLALYLYLLACVDTVTLALDWIVTRLLKDMKWIHSPAYVLWFLPAGNGAFGRASPTGDALGLLSLSVSAATPGENQIELQLMQK